MENKTDTKITSLSKPIYGFFSIGFAVILFFGGIATTIYSLCFKQPYIFEGLMMIGVGSCLITSIYNMVLYIESLSHTAKIIEQVDQLATHQSLIKGISAIPMFTFQVGGIPHQKTLQDMTLEELKVELKKAVSSESYEMAAQIRSEINKRK